VNALRTAIAGIPSAFVMLAWIGVAFALAATLLKRRDLE
jgi:hypothetical protein